MIKPREVGVVQRNIQNDVTAVALFDVFSDSEPRERAVCCHDFACSTTTLATVARRQWSPRPHLVSCKAGCRQGPEHLQQDTVCKIRIRLSLDLCQSAFRSGW